MRLPIPALCLLAVACTQTPLSGPPDADSTRPAPVRPEREGLLAGCRELQGSAISHTKKDGWTLRHTAAGRRQAAAPSEARPRADAYYMRSKTRTPATVATAADDGIVELASVAESVEVDTFAATTALPEANTPPAVLRAGSTDDNLTFDDYLTYLDQQRAHLDNQNRFLDIDVRGRCSIQIVDSAGAIVAGTPVTIVDEDGDAVIWRGTSYGDGRVPFYPAVAASGRSPAAGYLIEVPVGDRVVQQRWNGHSDAMVQLPEEHATAPLMLDVAFVIDTTGSMGDEIAAIKATLLQVTARLRDLGREFELRYGAVLYRDLGDEYVTALHEFTGDIEAFDAMLKKVQAGGGGDGPESLNQGLAAAVDELQWRAGAAKVAFLIADAPPHLDYDGDVAYDRSLQAAVAEGIRIHTVAASGLDQAGSLVFRQIAQFTRGEFVFLEYGGDLQVSAAKHGVSSATGNNLDDILFTRIRDEIAHWGQDHAALASTGSR